MNLIKLENVTKKYGDNIGCFDVNVNLQGGEIYRFIGPNSADKTTLIRQMIGFIKSDATLMESSFAPNNSTSLESSNVEAPFNTIFIFPSIIIFFGLSIILIYQVIIREISKAYFISWLTTPMARRTTLNSKF